jgi:uncharacterized membrane protein
VTDPVVARRRQIDRGAALAKRVGYAGFGLAVVLFGYGLFTRFSAGVTTAITALLVVSSIVLAPAIVLGYAVKAADREDRERG